MLASLARPSSGEILFDGKNIEHDGAGAKAAIGFVSHATFLYGELTVREKWGIDLAGPLEETPVLAYNALT